VEGRTLEVRFPSEFGWERPVLEFTGSVARRMGFPSDRVEDLKTAVNEAISNAIEHGNSFSADERVQVVLAPTETRLEVNVRDHSSKPFPRKVEASELPSIDDQVAGLSPVRGWGIFLIRALVDESEFISTMEGNVVKLVMYLRPMKYGALNP
jgi:serine/threonine-protein kinase RsbW